MLAIVIPYYKLTFFEATLQSIANQTDKRFKVYIGDDASPEALVVLLDKYRGQFDFIYHRFESNLGGTSLTQQWERCIALSGDEEWIMILGDDDVLGENVVEKFYENLQEIKIAEIAVVRYATHKINEFGNSISDIYHHPKIETSADFLFRKTRSSLSEYVFLKEKILKIGFKDFPLAWFSDVLVVLEFSEFRNVFTINKAIVNVRISNLSISGNQENFKLKSKATFDFYYFLLTKKGDYFNENQRSQLRLKICKCYTNNKREINYFFKITKIYLTDFLIKEYYGFIKSIFFNFLEKKH
jgi:glycosyltransferase involved in cell wall biosynthesis